jgi:hypothetical protein
MKQPEGFDDGEGVVKMKKSLMKRIILTGVYTQSAKFADYH